MGKDKKGKKSVDETELSANDLKFITGLLESRNKDEASISLWVQRPKGKALLVVGKYRLYFISSKLKLDKDAHILDLKGIESKEENSCTLTFEGNFEFQFQSGKVNDIINLIRLAFETSFPTIDIRKRVQIHVEPDSRFQDSVGDTNLTCGGFAASYMAVCDYFTTPVREDIVWDISNLFPANNITEFHVEDFEQPVTSLEMASLLGALRYNSYFTGFNAHNINLDVKRTFGDIGSMLKDNTSMTKLVLSNVGMAKNAGVPVAEGLKANANSAVNVVDLSRNPMDENTLSAFGQWIGAMKQGLISLDISKCQVKKAGTIPFCQALKRNIHMANTLGSLNLSHNQLDAEGSSALSQFLANPNKLRHLEIENTSANLETLMPAVVRGCQEIQTINLAGNKLGARSTQSLVTFLQSSATVTSVNLSNTGLGVDQVKSIIESIGGNMYLTDFILDISNNKLGVQGAKILSDCIALAKNISDLDISDNDFGDDGMQVLCTGLSSHPELRTLRISRNFSPKPMKNRMQAVENLISLICGESPIRRLVFRGGPTNAMRTDILPILDGIGTNETLLFLDISGQLMGTKGALALSKALQTNRHLEHLVWDENGTGLAGFESIVSALHRNRTLKEMPLPLVDVTSALKTEPQPRILKVMERLQALLARNQNPKSTLGQGGGIQFSQLAFLTSGEREHVERLKFKIKSRNKRLNQDQSLVLQDAENNDSNLSSVYGLVEAHQAEMAAEIRTKLKDLATDVMPVINKHFQNMVGSVLESVSEQYKSLEPDAVRRMNTSIQFGTELVQSETVEKILASAATAEISQQASKSFQTALEIVTDYLFEKLSDELQAIVEDVQVDKPRQSVAIFDSAKAMSELREMSDSPAMPDIPEPEEKEKPPSKTPPQVASRDGRPPVALRTGGASPAVRGKLAATLPAGFDPTRMLGGGRGGPPVPARTSVTEEPEPEPEPTPEPSTPTAKEDKKRGGGLFGKKKSAPTPSPKGKPKKPVKGAPPTTVKKVKKPSGDTDNMKQIDAAVKEAEQHTALDHPTRDRPMQRKRKPPTRRPRNMGAT